MIGTKTQAHSDEDDLRNLDPVQEREGEEGASVWTRRLVLFLRVMAGVSMLKGLYHWSRLVGIGMSGDLFEYHSIAWQAATVFFAVLDLVAAVGLWLGHLADVGRLDAGAGSVLPAGVRFEPHRRLARDGAALLVSAFGAEGGAGASALTNMRE